MYKSELGIIFVNCFSNETKRHKHIARAVADNEPFMKRHKMEIQDPEYMMFKDAEKKAFEAKCRPAYVFEDAEPEPTADPFIEGVLEQESEEDFAKSGVILEEEKKIVSGKTVAKKAPAKKVVKKVVKTKK